MAQSKTLLKIASEYEAELTRLEDEAIARLNKSIEEAYKKLVSQINKKYPDLEQNLSLLPAQREALLAEQLGGLLNIIDPEDSKEYQSMFRGLIGDSHRIGGESVEEMIRAIDPDFDAGSFSRLPVKAVNLAAQNAYQRLQRHGDDFALKASQVISQGIALGWGNRRIAGVIKQQTGNTRRNAEMITRTETASAMVGATKERYTESGINYVIWITALREVCPWCVWKAGKIYRTEEVVIPQHPWCRCSVIPITPQWARDALIDFDTIEAQSKKVREALKGQPKSTKAPFEAIAPKAITIEELRRKRG